MQVSILIVNYNTGKILEECIDSIYRFEQETLFEIIVVDNNSSDDSVERIEKIKSKFQNVRSIMLKGKVSFSEANNIAFDISSGEFVLIMNPDIIFTQPVLKRLLDDLQKDISLGAVCPLLEGKDGRFQSRYFQKYPSLLQFIFFYSVFAKFFQWSSFLANKYLETRDLNLSEGNLIYVQQIPCAFFLSRRQIILDAGKMDPDYQLFFEDVDLSYRIGKQFKLAIDASLRVTHLGGESFKTSDDYWLYGRFIISMIHFFDKNYGRSKAGVLKNAAKLNSHAVLMMESAKNLLGKGDNYRIRKHKFFLSELGQN